MTRNVDSLIVSAGEPPLRAQLCLVVAGRSLTFPQIPTSDVNIVFSGVDQDGRQLSALAKRRVLKERGQQKIKENQIKSIGPEYSEPT